MNKGLVRSLDRRGYAVGQEPAGRQKAKIQRSFDMRSMRRGVHREKLAARPAASARGYGQGAVGHMSRDARKRLQANITARC